MELRTEAQIIETWQPSETAVPVLSICCITYNHARYIEQALTGFLIQKTTFPIEILIHDDASTDGTADIIRAYEQRYPKIIKPTYQVENQFSKGVRVGIDNNYNLATGEYVAFCEGDDYWTDSCKLQKQVDFLNGHPDYSMTSHDVTFEYDNINEKRAGYTANPLIDGGLKEILKAGFFIALNSMVFRRHLLVFPPWAYALQGTHKAMIYMLTAKGMNHHFVENMGVKRRHQGGITVQQKMAREQSYFARNIFLLENLKAYCDHSKDDIINRKLRQLLLMKARKELMRLQVSQAIRSLLQAASYTFGCH